MTLAKLLDELNFIADHCETSDVEVVVQSWDDNPYDGDKVEGLRLVTERDIEKDESLTTLFIIHGQGR